MGKELGVSRAAISAHVKALQKAGYGIVSAGRRGYRLESAPDLLSAFEVHPLSAATTMGKVRYVYEQTIDSTNTRARHLAEKGCPEGTVVIAEEQTEGKGRKGREWVSPSGMGIYATLVLRPRLPLEDTPLLTLVTAVATADAINRAAGMTPTIKWPNDILVNDRKTAGILTEVSSDVDQVDFALIGLGLNVNTPEEELPRRPIFPATSLAIESGKPQSRAALLAAWLDCFETEYAQLIAGKRERLLERWKSRAMIMGRNVTIRRVHDTVEGTITDIDMDGALLLDTREGERQRILSGDITFACR